MASPRCGGASAGTAPSEPTEARLNQLPCYQDSTAFDDAQLVELTHVIALEYLRGRFNAAFGVGAAGFSEGMVCAVPARAPDAAPAGTR